MEQRRAQRYRLELPLQIVQLGELQVGLVQKTRDISSGGVCFVSVDDIKVGARIEYVITLSSNDPEVRIRCLGKVLRSRPFADEATHTAGHEVAVSMDRYQFVRTENSASASA